MNKVLKENQCQTTVYPKDTWGAFHGYQCKKPLWKDGYCKVHHPDSVEKRDKASRERWNKKWANSPEMRLSRALEEIKVLREAAGSACALARIKYGNLDPDVDKELTRIEELIKTDSPMGSEDQG